MSSPYQQLDQLMKQANPDYFNLYNQLLQMSTALPDAVDDVELWWRLAKVTYLLTLNINMEAEPERTQQKLTEAKQHVEKALALAPNHFSANLWMAMTIGKLALLEKDQQRMVDMVALLLKHLSVCEALNPDDPQLLYLDARIKVGLCCVTEEAKSLLLKNSATAHLFPVDLNIAEQKLRRAIDLVDRPLECYVTLAHLLACHMDKHEQAKEVAQRGLKLQRFTTEDFMIGLVLEQIIKMEPGDPSN